MASVELLWVIGTSGCDLELLFSTACYGDFGSAGTFGKETI
jgi:hypothetical protein